MLSSDTPRPARRRAPSTSPASSPHTPTQRPCACCAPHGEVDEPQERGDRARRERRDVLVAALGGHRVLGEVVRADREEVELAGEALGLDRDGGHLDHHPDLEGRVDAQGASGLVERGPRCADLADRRDHREHDLDRVLGGGPQHGAQLRGEQVGPGELQADAAAAEERVGLRLLGQRAQRLVGADVERADDERAAAEPARDGRVRLGLLVLVGQLVAVEEQELRAQQADALGAVLDGRGRAVDVAEVREDLDGRPVRRDGRLGRRARRATACRSSAAAARAR